MKKCETTIFLLCDFVRVYNDEEGNIRRSFGFTYKHVTLIAKEGKRLTWGMSFFPDLEQEEEFEEFGKYIIIVGNGEEEGSTDFIVEKVLWDLCDILEYLLRL